MGKQEYFLRLTLVYQHSLNGLRWSQYRNRASVRHTEWYVPLRRLEMDLLFVETHFGYFAPCCFT